MTCYLFLDYPVFSLDSGDADIVVIGGGPGGYVAAIKAAQLGMKVSLMILLMILLQVMMLTCLLTDCLHRKTRCLRRDMFECRMHSIKGSLTQLTPLPSRSFTRTRETRDRSGQRPPELGFFDETKNNCCLCLNRRNRSSF